MYRKGIPDQAPIRAETGLFSTLSRGPPEFELGTKGLSPFEVLFAVEAAELRDVKVVTFMALCRSYCYELPEDLPDQGLTLSDENAYYDIWMCGEDKEVDDYQCLGRVLGYFSKSFEP